MHMLVVIFSILVVSSCVISKGKIVVDLKSPKQASPSANFYIANVQLINNQFVLTGVKLDGVTDVKIKEGSTETALVMESQNSTTIITNTISNVTLAAGKVFEFILSDATASSTFVVNFSLCDSTLNGKGFNCSITANDKDVLSFDALSNKWIPRNVNGLSYKGTHNASGGVDPGGSPTAGDYFIITVPGIINSVSYAVGDWISYSGDEWQKIANARNVLSVYGRTGNITAREGDYNLDKLTDVDLTTTAPVTGNILRFNSSGKWIPGTVVVTESDPNVSAFAKSALPTCSSGYVLTSNGTDFSCVASSGAAPSGTAGGDLSGTYPNPTISGLAATKIGSGTVSNTAFGYLSGVTSDIQTQLSGKVTSVTGTAPVTVGGTAAAPVVSMAAATTSVNGYLTSTDWTTFNNKQTALSAGPTINGIDYPANTSETLIIPLAPVNATDAVNKLYVDNLISGLSFVGGSGTAGAIPRFTAGSTLGDSGLSDDGAKITATRAIVSTPNTVATGATINLSTSNTHLLSSVGGTAITLQNLVHGGQYNIIIADPASRIYTFSGCTNSYFRPGNVATTINTRTIYGILVYKSGSNFDCYITWSSGFE